MCSLKTPSLPPRPPPHLMLTSSLRRMSAYISEDSISPVSPSPGTESPIAQAPLGLTQDFAIGRGGPRNEYEVGLLETTAFGTSACADPVSSSPATRRAGPTAEEEGKARVDLFLRGAILSQERARCIRGLGMGYVASFLLLVAVPAEQLLSRGLNLGCTFSPSSPAIRRNAEDAKCKPSCAQVDREQASIQCRCSSQAGGDDSLRLGCVCYVGCRVPESSTTLSGMYYKQGAVVKRPLIMWRWICVSQAVPAWQHGGL